MRVGSQVRCPIAHVHIQFIGALPPRSPTAEVAQHRLRQVQMVDAVDRRRSWRRGVEEVGWLRRRDDRGRRRSDRGAEREGATVISCPVQ